MPSLILADLMLLHRQIHDLKSDQSFDHGRRASTLNQ